MLKNKRILLTILVALMLLLVPSIVNAADGEVNVTSIEVTAPQSGVYAAGQEITIRMNFDKAVKGTMPELNIYFGNVELEKELTVPTVTTATNYIEYTYTITTEDNGILVLNGRGINYELTDENNNTLELINSIYTLTGNTIYAENSIARADFNNAKFEWVSTFEHNVYLDLKLTNVQTIEDNRYYVHLSHNKNEQISALSYENYDVWKMLDENNTVNSVENIVAENGDIYVWVCEVDGTYRIPKLLVSGEKIERKSQLPLGKRLLAYFFNDSTSTFCDETMGKNERQINVKIGMITDTSILKAIKNGEANALQRLLDYSKTAEAFYTGTVPVGDSDSVVSNLGIIDDEYYYVYMELDDENGKYYPVEDVSLYQGCVSQDIGTNLFDYLSDEFKWNLDEEQGSEPTPAPQPEKKPTNTKDETQAPGKLPYTGGTFVIVVSVLAIITLGIYAYRRNNDLKGI